MKKSAKTVLAIVAMVAFVSMSFMAAKGLVLKLNLQKGENYTVTVKSSQTIVMSIQGQNMTQGMTMEQTGILNVTDKNTVLSKWDAVYFKASAMGMDMIYDSKHPENTNPMIKAQVKPYEDMLNEDATYKFDEQGKNLESTANEKSVGPAESVIKELPKDELVKGYSWTKEGEKEAQGAMVKTTTTLTVKEVTKKNVIVDYVGKGSADEVSMSFSGTLTYNIANGMVVKNVVKQDVTASVSEQGMTIPVKVSGTTEIVVK